jgi:hypothetical protein
MAEGGVGDPCAVGGSAEANVQVFHLQAFLTARASIRNRRPSFCLTLGYVKDCKRSEACLHPVYNYVGLSRVYGLWGFNPVPLFFLQDSESLVNNAFFAPKKLDIGPKYGCFYN